MSAGVTFGMIIAVAAGGAIGASARLLTVDLAARLFGYDFPWGTFTVNVIGSLIMGLLVGWMTVRWDAPQTLRVFLATGMLGGFTTFSSYALDFALLWENRQHTAALLYAAGSVLVAIAAVFAGLWLARAIWQG